MSNILKIEISKEDILAVGWLDGVTSKAGPYFYEYILENMYGDPVEELDRSVNRSLHANDLMWMFSGFISEFEKSYNKSEVFNFYNCIKDHLSRNTSNDNLFYERKESDNQFAKFFEENEYIIDVDVRTPPYPELSIIIDNLHRSIDLDSIDTSEKGMQIKKLKVKMKPDEMKAITEMINSGKSINAILGYNNRKSVLNLYIFKNLEKSIYITFTPNDIVVYLEGSDVIEFIENPVDSNLVSGVKKKPFDPLLLNDFIERKILMGGYKHIYVQTIIPDDIFDTFIQTIPREYAIQYIFTFTNRLDIFDMALRSLSVIFNKEYHNTSDRSIQLKLFNEMERDDGSRKIFSVDEWNLDHLTYIDNGEKKYIPRRNNDMMVLLMNLYDEGTLDKRVKKAIDRNIFSFRKNI